MPTFRAFFLCLAVVVSSSATADAGVPSSGDSPATEPTAVETVTGASRRAYVALGAGAAVGDFGTGATGHNPRLLRPLDIGTASASISLRAGYRFCAHLAAELLWDYQPGWDLDVHSAWVTSGTADGALSTWNLSANAKGYLTDGRWQPFMLVGIGIGRRETDADAVYPDPTGNHNVPVHKVDTAFVARVGGGLEVEISDAWTFGGEVVWVLGTDELDTLDYAITSLVLAYRFW